MKALTIWQPWASLIMAGAKPYEFRRWPAHGSVVDQRIVIHAAARLPHPDDVASAWEDARGTAGASLGGDEQTLAKAAEVIHPWFSAKNQAEFFILGAGLGTAVLGAPHKCVNLFAGRLPPDVIDPDMYAWPLTDIEPFDTPVPMRGAQGFWNWPLEVAA